MGQGHILVIAEKPRSAEKIAQALSDGAAEKRGSKRAYWFEFSVNGKHHVVAPAVGHLFTLRQSGKGWKYPVYEMEWAPIFEVSKTAGFSKEYYENISKLAKGAEEVIVACDYDIEGDVIGFNILRFLCEREKARRMKFSTLTKPDIVEAYEKVMPSIDFFQVEAGLTRHQLDWLWGLNSTRALTLAVKNATNRFKILSSGRVQGPTLEILYKKEKEIGSFVPKPFWEVSAEITVGKEKVLASLAQGRLWERSEAESKKGERALLRELDKKKVRKKQPVPFDLTTLQIEAFRHFRFSPRQTVDIAQKLYEAGYISYPRTSSQKLPDKIGYREIIEALKSVYGELAKSLLKGELKPREGEKNDPAHPAIYPTASVPDYQKLEVQEKRLYDLIARRFLATFAQTSLREQTRAAFDIENEEYIAEGSRILERGWLDFYTYAKPKEHELPVLEKGKEYPCSVSYEGKETSPPPRFTQASIIREMEKEGLGTKATRAHILQTLYDRGYIDGISISVTDIGGAVVKTLDKYCPAIVSPELTKKFEEKMELIMEGKENREKVLREAKELLSQVLEGFKSNELIIGKELADAIEETSRKFAEIGPCKCGATLKMIFTRKGRFIGCSGYPNCRNSYPLPRMGKIIKTDKECSQGHPLLKIIRMGKRPWLMCIDPNCPTKHKDAVPAPGVSSEATAEPHPKED